MSARSRTAPPRASARRPPGQRRPPPPGGRERASKLLASALLLCAAACGEEPRDTVGVNARHPAGRELTDGGPGHADDTLRPDGGPSLPPADARVVVPFGGRTVSYLIEVEADPGVLDVQLSIDTTASMGPEIHELQRDLERKLVPELRDRVPDVNFGVAKFADFPRPPFGSDAIEPDAPFVLLSPITSDVSRVATAVAALDQPLGNGGDLPEAGAEALWQIATGEGYAADGRDWIAPFDRRSAQARGDIGGVGFREGALRVVLHVTDAPSHVPADYDPQFPDTHDLAQAGKALRGIGAKLVAIVAGTCDEKAAATEPECDEAQHRATRDELERLAIATGALGAPPVDDECPHGVGGAAVESRDGKCPLVFDIDAHGGGLTDTSIDAIADLVDGVRFDAVTGSAIDDPIGFVAGVVPVRGDGDGEDEPELADLLPEGRPDGHADSFVRVRARTKLTFEVQLRNRVIAPSDVDQAFRVVVQVKGDALILREETLRLVVPKGSALAPPTDDDDGGT